ncbi:helix-turn-helix transcriptional regulator [Alkalihalophilus lindianensis]|uniref:Helix-turn-helix transcriptional regulator n=1 Tax=Alkalihalophilus lindianensis TaxID=1630542 RepID=A0ABU3X937_9BACI|nr:helix-turn-helix transcriptional regulator [Alkalihalophilus lindianensis]MDV2684395.1 helix-turn-helix transcriptional regulator [Alkalihalophilus lindianensis]
MKEKPILNIKIGQVIRNRRKMLGMTIEKLAAESRVNEKHLGDIERGLATIKYPTLLKIEKGLGYKKPGHLSNDEEILKLYEKLFEHVKDNDKEEK